MHSRLLKSVATLIVVIALTFSLAGCFIKPEIYIEEPYVAYLFVHFINEENDYLDEQIYFSVSIDGKNWETLNDGKPVLISMLGEYGVRDPHIIRNHSENGYYLVATDLSIHHGHKCTTNRPEGLTRREYGWSAAQTNGSLDIVVWKSKGNTLVEWETPTLHTIAPPNASCVWAPEVIWDDDYDGGMGAYMIYWASKTNADWIYRIYRAYTQDFITFTEPELYVDNSESCIDLTYVKDGDWYYRFSKNGGDVAILMEKGSSLSGEFEPITTFNIDGAYGDQLACFEGPTCYKLNDSEEWCLLLDNYTGSLDGGYLPFITEDLSSGNFMSAEKFVFDSIYRHGTVMPIKQSELNELLDAWKNASEE